MATPFNLESFLQLHEALVSIPGPTGGEGPRVRLLRDHLQQHGLSCRQDAAGNLLCTIGRGDWRDSVLLDAHVDVVEEGVCGVLQRDSGRLIGRGVSDNIAAVTLLAMKAIELVSSPAGLPRPVEIAFTVGEEGFGNLAGARQIVSDHDEPPRLWLSLDSTQGICCVDGLGSMRYGIEVQCQGGHSWKDYPSPSAVQELVDLLASLRRAHSVVAAEFGSTLSFNVGNIRGGEGINVIARRAEATVEFRSSQPDALLATDDALRRLVETFGQSEGVEASVSLLGERPAARGRHREWVLALLEPAAERAHVTWMSETMSTNANAPLAAGWPAACVGLVRGGRAHREDEYLELDSVEKGWRLLHELVAVAAGDR